MKGLSEIASYVCGYGLRNDSGYRENTNISLFNWSQGNALPDYTRAALWTLYLLEQYPNNLMKLLVQSDKDGYSGINQALGQYNPTPTRQFNEIFIDWLIANYLQDKTVNPKWGYEYPNSIASVPFETHLSGTAAGTGPIQKVAGKYISFKGTLPEKITFSSSNAPDSLGVKALKIGSPSKVEDVPINSEYEVNGAGYTEVTFLVI